MRREKSISAVLFDFDGTLAEMRIDFQTMRKRVIDILERMGIRPALLKSQYVLELIEEGATVLQDEGLERQMRAETRKAMEEVEMKAAAKASAFPWVEEMALELAQSGIRTGIVSRNCRRAVTKILGPLADLFQVLVTRDEITTVKPNPNHLWHALSLFPGTRVPPEKAAMVGDHPMDIKGAREAGLWAIGVLTGAGTLETLSGEKADLILVDASQVPLFIMYLNSPEGKWLQRR